MCDHDKKGHRLSPEERAAVTKRHPALEELTDIAEHRTLDYAAYRTVTSMPDSRTPPPQERFWAQRVYLESVARKFLNVEQLPPGRTAFDILFEPAAITQLMLMPNNYWLWAVIGGSISYGAQGPISVEQVKSAIEHQVSLMLDQLEGGPSPWSPRPLTVEEIVLHVVVGVQLLNKETGKLVRNPMFDMAKNGYPQVK